MKFRKSPHRTKKALRHAQKPATPRSANPIGWESTSVEPGKDPPMATPPPKGRKMAPERPCPSLIETGKSHPKTGLFQRFSDGFLGKFADSFRAVLPRFAGGFPAVRWRRSAPGSTPVRLRSTPSSERNCRAIPYTLSSLQTQHMGRGKFPPVHGVPGRSAAGRNPTPLVEVLGDRIAVQDASGGISLGTSPTGHSGQRDADFA